MPHSFGIRARTRDLFSRKPGTKGQFPLSTYLTTYRVGDYVDVVANGAIHKGMPHKFYHGKTGVVWNVTRRAIGVIINKQVNGRIMPKKIHVRIEHCRPSKCNSEFKKRVQENLQLVSQAKENGTARPVLKRTPRGPLPAETLDMSNVDFQDLEAERYISFYV